MKTLFGALLLVLISPTISCAQTSDSISVMHPINKLFDGMRISDSSMVYEAFHKEISMYTSYISEDGMPKIEEGSLEEFLVAVGTPHSAIWDEKIWNVKVLIDESLAQVWCDYGFYVDNRFSHCGVDAFQLVKNDRNEWQIISLIDTRKKANCFLPEGK